jgi:predicted nucleic acid-binding protein
VIVVCDSSPLIALAKIDSFVLFQKLYGGLIISGEVYAEVVVAGAGLAGATDTSKSAWIEVRQIKNPADLTICTETVVKTQNNALPRPNCPLHFQSTGLP